MEDPTKYVIDKLCSVKSYEEYQSLQMKPEESNDLFGRLVKENEPFCAGKMGFVEIMSLNRQLTALSKGEQTDYTGVAQMLFFNAGVFPASVANYDKFNEVYLSHIPDLDFFGMWVFGPEPPGVTEKEVYEKWATSARGRGLVCAGCWDPFHHEKPWTGALRGKKVLVVSPFADTMHKQYAKRDKIWDNPDILPQFDELRTIKCPLSAGFQQSPYDDWHEGLDKLKKAMNEIDFDVCFVGAGAWGLPLAVHAKRLGKVGIHSGGDLQLMFGIKGKRWDANPSRSCFYNEHWVRPSEEETPRAKELVENGCYW